MADDHLQGGDGWQGHCRDPEPPVGFDDRLEPAPADGADDDHAEDDDDNDGHAEPVQLVPSKAEVEQGSDNHDQQDAGPRQGDDAPARAGHVALEEGHCCERENRVQDDEDRPLPEKLPHGSLLSYRV